MQTIFRNSSNEILRYDGYILRSKEGLYNEWEIDDLIYNQDYIPVASGSELDSLRNTGSRTMGVGTKWEGAYNTGLDKKYVQVLNIDLLSFAPLGPYQQGWSRIGLASPNNFTGIYDGNELWIKNLQIDALYTTILRYQGVFGICNNAKLRNMRVSGYIKNNQSHNGLIAGFLLGSDSECVNCYAYGEVQGLSLSAGLIGRNHDGTTTGGLIFGCKFVGTVIGTTESGGLVGSIRGASSKIENCYVNATITTTRNGGGIVGMAQLTTIKGCIANVTLTATSAALNSNTGGIVGYATGTTIIDECYVKGTVESTKTDAAGDNVGGLVGAFETTTSIIRNCFSQATVICGRNRAGGLIGWLISGQVINSYSTGAVTGVSSVGGFSGTTAGVITNCYYDKDTAGLTAGPANARTTEQMKEGTKDSFILPAGGTDPDSLAANAMYTSWDDVDTWEFGTTSEYPTLK